jgi:N-methylhydantoinase B/oxoprolinase/acetone carboxylase alpha subunit
VLSTDGRRAATQATGPGEAIVIQTPTAGGYGDPNERKR